MMPKLAKARQLLNFAKRRQQSASCVILPAELATISAASPDKMIAELQHMQLFNACIPYGFLRIFQVPISIYSLGNPSSLNKNKSTSTGGKIVSCHYSDHKFSSKCLE